MDNPKEQPTDPLDSLTNADLKAAVIGWRGGIPSKCDFCGKETPEQDLHPEEAGMWICIGCIERIGY